MGGGSSPPQPTPPGQTIAQATQSNTQAGRASQSGSLINQSNPYGSLQYQQSGVDQFGNPIWTSNLNLSPSQQQLFNILTGTQTQAGQQGQGLIQGANYGGQSPSQAIGDETSGLTGTMMGQWLQAQAPWMSQATTELDTKLKNQGINPSPTADPNNIATWGPYEKAMGQLRQSQQMGVAGAASQFQPQAFQEATQLYGLPAQLGMMLSQFGQPTSPGSSLVQTPGLNIQPADVAGITSQADQMRMNAYIAQQQQQAAMMQGLFGLGGKIGSAAIFGASDIRLKENIKKIGRLVNGLFVYSFNYIWSDEPQIGLIAQEVELVHPKAVVEYLGYKYVNYTEAVK